MGSCTLESSISSSFLLIGQNYDITLDNVYENDNENTFTYGAAVQVP